VCECVDVIDVVVVVVVIDVVVVVDVVDVVVDVAEKEKRGCCCSFLIALNGFDKLVRHYEERSLDI